MMFDKPEIGTNVKVTTDWSDFYSGCVDHLRAIRKRNTLIGEVVSGEEFDDPNSFRIATNNSTYPISIVSLKQVVQLINIDSCVEMDGDAVVEEARNETWTVDGSKGNVYTITVKDEYWTCSCLGFSFRRQCKHINERKVQ